MPPDDTRYETDFFEWSQEQASRLREAASLRLNAKIDWENIAEEVESLGRSDLAALKSHAARIIEHLLKLEYSPAREPRRGWRHSVASHRTDAEELIETSPSLRARLKQALPRCYRSGRRLAIEGPDEDRIDASSLPAECPYDLDDVLDPDWLPTNRHGLD
jgi:hypothetical protein